MNLKFIAKKFLRSYVPWIITLVALFIVFKGVDIDVLFGNLRTADLSWIFLAFASTLASYFLRAYRWEYFFPTPSMRYIDALRVLFLGFFMNNILPARAGELVRAHTGAKITGETRTLVLATIASERLADGLTISFIFLLFGAGIGDPNISRELLYVALAFGVAAIMIIAALILREPIFRVADLFFAKSDTRASNYINERFKIFLNGLSPLLTPSKLPGSITFSLLIWIVELFVYYSVAEAYGSDLSLSLCVLFMVAVNFSSLIPAAPGGIGVIELIATTALVSVGVDHEHALTMVITQHALQYLAVGIPGAAILLTWEKPAYAGEK